MATNPANVKALRTELKNQSLDAFIVPLTDEHMSEYVGAYAGRLSWLTGFEGSAGNAVVTMDAAAIFIDGRYVIQVVSEVDDAYFERLHFQEYPLTKWLSDHTQSGDTVGYDPELATVAQVKSYTAAVESSGASLIAVDANPIDAVWSDQPAEPMDMAVLHDIKYTGRSAADKRADIADILKSKKADSAVITQLDSVAWAFNIRGTDVENTPVTHAFALMHADETADLFINAAKINDEIREALGNAVRVRPREEFYVAMGEMASAGKSVLVDKVTNNAKVFNALEGATLVEGDDPCILPKAIKNDVEMQGAKDAHIRDGAAIAEFLAFLDEEAPKETLDELKAVDILWQYRKRRNILKDTSFDTISGSASNGALCHYRVSEETNLPITKGTLYLFDSGGQYLDGTTDITRTIAVGTPTAEMKDRFTRVLKGHIALSTIKFPKGTAGAALDTVARRPLWEVGLDYDHGTGHGVGSYLSVHEGPQRIGKGVSSTPIEAGMILSNEPGYYKENEYGIRIENLVLVRKCAENADFEREMLEFENLTWAPIDLNLVDASIMTAIEINWLNDYHATVSEKLMPIVDDKTKAWLKIATAPILE